MRPGSPARDACSGKSCNLQQPDINAHIYYAATKPEKDSGNVSDVLFASRGGKRARCGRLPPTLPQMPPRWILFQRNDYTLSCSVSEYIVSLQSSSSILSADLQTSYHIGKFISMSDSPSISRKSFDQGYEDLASSILWIKSDTISYPPISTASRDLKKILIGVCYQSNALV